MRVAFASVLSCLAGGQAFGQWTAISLHPAGAYESAVSASASGMFGGFVEPTAGHYRPALWQGLSSNWTDLLSPSATFVSAVTAMWGNQQGGYYDGGALWTSTPESRIDLGGERVDGMGSGQQVGSATVQIGGVQHDHAVVWAGTAASMVDLNPSAAGFQDSIAYATDGQHQGGWVKQSPSLGPHLAAMWTGTAASYVNMNPSWSGYSGITAMIPGQQVGATRAAGSSDHATIWSGAAETALDVNPFPGFSSYLAATIGTAQAGKATVPGFSFQHAGVWFGTAASFVDLHQFLPPGYGISAATTIQEWNGQLIIGGWASRTGPAEAWIWVAVPAPAGSAVLLSGLLIAGRRQRRAG